jgi:hypothetical protein
VLFKYRSLQDWRHVLDIFLNKRLHAAKFKEMNDPMVCGKGIRHVSCSDIKIGSMPAQLIRGETTNPSFLEPLIAKSKCKSC